MVKEISGPLWLERHAKIIFATLFIFVIFDIGNTFFRFAMVYTDMDQALLWNAANDIRQGHFHGLCFYGQGYNPLIEPLFAAPFLWLGLSINVGLPLVSTILGISPYLLIAGVFYKKYGAYTALLPLIIILLLPPEFMMSVSMPRGFVTGVFFTVIGLLLFIYQSNRFYYILAGLCFGLGLFANPNGVLLFPLMIPILFDKSNNIKSRILFTFSGLCIGLIPMAINKYYYMHHLEMIIHPSPASTFSIHSFLSAFTHLDDYFDFISPIFWRAGWISLFFFIIIAVLLIKKGQKIKFYSLLIAFFLIILSFTFDKVCDATNSIYFSGSRFYLAYPVILVFIITWGFQELNIRHKKIFLSFSLMLALLAFSFKVFAFDAFMKIDLGPSKNSIVQVMKVDELFDKCRQLKNFPPEKPGLIIGMDVDKILNYGCPCMINDFPPDMLLDYERRTWLLPKMKDSVYARILIYGLDSAAWIKTNAYMKGDVMKGDKSHGLLFIRNHKKTGDLVRDLAL